MIPNRRTFFFFVLTVLYAVLLMTVLLLPSDSIPAHRLFSVDKLWHFLTYFILALSLMFSFREGGWDRRYNRRWSLVTALAHAGVSEVLQVFVPGRSAGLDDWLANCIGIGIALLGLHLFPRFFEKAQESS
jgi:VanZ family protein